MLSLLAIVAAKGASGSEAFGTKADVQLLVAQLMAPLQSRIAPLQSRIAALEEENVQLWRRVQRAENSQASGFGSRTTVMQSVQSVDTFRPGAWTRAELDD